MNLSKKRITVTGGKGFLGTHLVGSCERKEAVKMYLLLIYQNMTFEILKI